MTIKMILLGPIIGCSRNNTITIGYEVSLPCYISISIWDSNGNIISSYEEQSLPGKLSCQDLPITGTGPYKVCISIPDEDCPNEREGSFSLGTNIAVASCNNLRLGSSRLWENMNKRVPSLCLHIGDNLYTDYGDEIFSRAENRASEVMDCQDLDTSWDSLVEIFRQGYRILWSTPHMKEILSSCCNMFIWDDHDVCDSWDQDISINSLDTYKDTDGSIRWKDIAPTVDTPHKVAIVAAIQAYCEYQLPLSLGASAPSVPGSFTYEILGKKILFLDRRMHLVANTPLLPEGISVENKPDVIVSGVPLFYLHPCVSNVVVDWFLKKFAGLRDLHDHWLLFPQDLEEILSILKEGSLLLSGDVHMCGKTRMNIREGDTSFSCIQVTSSAISSPSPPRVLLLFLQILNKFRAQIGGYECSISHDSWTRDNGYVTFDICNIDRTIEYILVSLLDPVA